MADANVNAYEVGEGRCNVYYTESGRRLRFDMARGDGASQSSLHICIDPFPNWYSPEDYSTLGPVSEDHRPQVLVNIRTTFEKQFYHCIFEDRNGNVVTP